MLLLISLLFSAHLLYIPTHSSLIVAQFPRLAFIVAFSCHVAVPLHCFCCAYNILKEKKSYTIMMVCRNLCEDLSWELYSNRTKCS